MMIQGKAYWFRALGKPHDGYKSTADADKLWSFDLSIDADTKAKFNENRIGNKVKNKGDDRGDFVTWKRRAFKRDGTPAKPIRVVDRNGQPWDPNKKIGNGSVVNVQFLINDADTETPRPSVIAVQVWDLVEYEGSGEYEEFPVDASGNEAW